MNSIAIVVVDQSASGSYHVKVLVDEKDSGFLYLSSEQFDFFVKSFWRSCSNNGVSFSVENPFDDTNIDDVDQAKEE